MHRPWPARFVTVPAVDHLQFPGCRVTTAGSIESLADNTPGHSHVGQRLNIVERCHASRGNHRQVYFLLHSLHRLQVGSLEHPVSGNIRVNQGRQRLPGQLPGHLDSIQVAHLVPAIGGNPSITGINANNQLAWKATTDVTKPIGISHRLGPNDQA